MINQTSRRACLSLCAILLIVCCCPHAPAQDSASDAHAPGDPFNTATGEILIDQAKGSLGAGGRFRPGEVTPLAFTITDRGTAIRNVLLRLETADIDGDTTNWSRPITTTPGKPGVVWLYARIPFNTDSFTVGAYEAIDRTGTDPDDASKVVYEPGRRLGSAGFSFRNPVEPSTAMMLIVGTNRAGLDPYTWRLSAQNSPPPLAHEPVELFPIKPTDLPDRALGLRGYDAIVWTGSGADEQPAKLSVQQADAIREWIAAGGHLIIVLPTVGQTWLEGSANPLADIMPAVAATRLDNVDLDAFRMMLTRRDPMKDGKVVRQIVLPSSTVLHTFAPLAGAGVHDAISILNAPAADTGRSEPVVVRRLYSAGAITLVGIDATHPALTGDSLRADFFWHRVLGRRGELVKAGAPDTDPTRIPTSREPAVMIDGVIDNNIQRDARSAGGLLLALVVFGAFWIVACPLSFFILKNRKLTHHAWLAFAASIAAFTAVSWTGASLLRQRTPDARFVAIIDHVYGQPLQRCRVWANLFLPEYGTQRVSIADAVSKESKWRPILTPWEPNDTSIGTSPFPDVRGYAVDSRSPESIEFPSRSTEKRVQIDWLGPPRWSMPLPLQPDSGVPPVFGAEIQLSRLDPPVSGRFFSINGTLKHNLPAPLENVQIVLVTGQSPLRSTNPTGDLLASARVWTRKDPWNPGDSLSLDFINQSGTDAITASDARGYLDGLVPGPRSTGIVDANAELRREMRADIVKYLNRITFYNVLPVSVAFDAYAPRASVVMRECTHNYDLGRWFTQPCIIVTGHIKRGESPVPIKVDGTEIQTTGHTMVRWIYPLPANPPEFQTAEPTETQ